MPPAKRDSSSKEVDPKDAMDTALRILGIRDHSKAELGQKLADRGFDDQTVEETVQKLVGYGYIDDERFAQSVIRSYSGLGRGGITRQMQKRGIDPQIWRPLVDQIDSEEEFSRALEAARKHTTPSKIASLSKEVWQRRLVGFLARRGFSTQTAFAVCGALSAEAEEAAEGMSEPW